MTYDFVKASDAMKIAEQQYATAAEIKFTAFTSCIGVVARKSALLTGVHLVLSAPDGSKFDAAAATTLVLDILKNDYDEVCIIGCVNIWKTPDNGVQAAYEKLTSLIKSLKVIQAYNFTDGTYGAAIDAGVIDITY